MAAVICGSLAFDSIMNFGGQFADQILPDQIHKLNVSFYVPQLRREFGGCAGNIAYALHLLGGQAQIVAALGNDGGSYIEHLQQLGISTAHIAQRSDIYTAQAMIMTDAANNQITAFHPGAMQMAHECTIPAAAGAQDIGIISPDGREAMLQHAAQFARQGLPFVFDPGQGLPMFNGAELLAFIAQATWVTVNDYEAEMLRERTGLSLPDLAAKVRGLVVTLGGEGCDVYENGACSRVAPVQAAAVLDPTGCGDAFRGGLLYGLERGWSLTRSAALGNQLGAIKIAHQGPQNYRIDAAALLKN
jgi:adenosine kinase